MDIQIVGVEQYDSDRLVVYRDLVLDDGKNVSRQPHIMPREMISIRAGEYDTDPDDPIILDMVLLEHLIQLEDPYEVHPLFAAGTIEEAKSVLEDRIESVRVAHNAPDEMKMRLLWTAADDDRSTQGLTDVKSTLMQHHDKEISMWRKIQLDQERVTHAKDQQRPARIPLVDRMRASTMGILRDQAIDEDRRRNPTGR